MKSACGCEPWSRRWNRPGSTTSAWCPARAMTARRRRSWRAGGCGRVRARWWWWARVGARTSTAFWRTWLPTRWRGWRAPPHPARCFCAYGDRAAGAAARRLPGDFADAGCAAGLRLHAPGGAGRAGRAERDRHAGVAAVRAVVRAARGAVHAARARRFTGGAQLVRRLPCAVSGGLSGGGGRAALRLASLRGRAAARVRAAATAATRGWPAWWRPTRRTARWS